MASVSRMWLPMTSPIPLTSIRAFSSASLRPFRKVRAELPALVPKQLGTPCIISPVVYKGTIGAVLLSQFGTGLWQRRWESISSGLTSKKSKVANSSTTTPDWRVADGREPGLSRSSDLGTSQAVITSGGSDLELIGKAEYLHLRAEGRPHRIFIGPPGPILDIRILEAADRPRLLAQIQGNRSLNPI